MKLSIVTPGYNEGEKIYQNLEKIKTYLDDSFGDSWEVIFVNDGSSDNTMKILSDISKLDQKIKVISYKVNRGRGYALRQGIDHAKGKYILTMESDLNWGLEIIKKLFDAIRKSQSDLIVASPYCKGGQLLNVPFKRAFISRIGNKILSFSIGRRVSMVSGMTRIYNRECIKSIPLASDDKEIHLEIISKAISLGYKISEIPATLAWPEKVEQKVSKRKSSFNTKKYVLSHLLFSIAQFPLLIFGFIGIIFLFIGIAIGSYLMIEFFVYQNIISDKIILILTTLFLSLFGVQTLLFSFLAYQNNNLKDELLLLHKTIKTK